MKTQTDKQTEQNLSSASVASDSPNITSRQAAVFPKGRSKAEKRQERLAWATWATAVYLSECCPTNTRKPSSKHLNK